MTTTPDPIPAPTEPPTPGEVLAAQRARERAAFDELMNLEGDDED